MNSQFFFLRNFLLIELRLIQGLRALQRLEATLAAPRPGQTVVKKPNPSSLLKQLLLGVIADINDMLQDVHGKKNLLAKRAIIRSLGELVELVKGDISNVGPQVSVLFFFYRDDLGDFDVILVY